MPSNCGIYQIVHKKTGQRYIGSSFQLEQRKKQHFYQGYWYLWTEKSYDKMKFSCRKSSKFHWGIIEYCLPSTTKKKLRKLEKKWMDLIPENLLLNANKIK